MYSIANKGPSILDVHNYDLSGNLIPWENKYVPILKKIFWYALCYSFTILISMLQFHDFRNNQFL